MARRYTARRIKSNRSYEVSEVAELVGVTPQTVRQWIKRGLPALTEGGPYLILGWALKAFLKATEIDRKRPLQPDEFYCLKCKAPRRPALGLVEETKSTDGRPIRKAFCEVCEQSCNRFVPADRETRPNSRKGACGMPSGTCEVRLETSLRKET